MKKYIRVCLSLDKETIEKITHLTWLIPNNYTKSAVIREAVKFLYEHTEKWR